MRLTTLIREAAPPGGGPTSQGGSAVTRRRRRDRWVFVARMSPLIVFLTLFFVVPITILLVYSFGYSSAVTTSFGLNLANYQSALTTGIYWAVMIRALVIGLITGCLCVLIAFPFVYGIVLGPLRKHSELFLFAVLLSLFSSYVVRVYAWRSLLGDQGIINTTLKDLHLVSHPVVFLLFSTFATVITLVNVLLPFAVLPIYASMIQIDPSVIEAARDLGANGTRSALKIALPLASSGVNGGFALCFIIAAGDYVTPQLVGGANSQMIGNVIAGQFGVAFNWPLGAALTFVFLALMALVLAAWIFLTRMSGLRGALR